MEIKLYLRMLQKSWWIVVLAALAAVLAALIAAYLTTPIYSSSARYVVSPNPAYLGGSVDYNLIYSLDTLDKRTIITTYAEVLNSPKNFNDTVQSLGFRESDLEGYSFSAVVLPETNIIDFTVTGTDPETVVLLTTTVSQRSVAYVENLYQIYNMGLLDPPAFPTEPISPQPWRDAGVALVVGAALGVGLALVRELLRMPIMGFLQQRNLDDMSQTLNRSAFQDTLKDVAFASASDLCLCYVQLEGLQEYRSILPQPTLQTIMRNVAGVLRNQLRGNDMVGRWDDLIFAVLLFDASGQATWNIMRRIQSSLSVPIKMDVSGEDLYLAPRIGIAEYRVGDTSESFVENAEWALEVARENDGLYLLRATEPI